VAFVSLAAESRQHVENFRQRYALPWPCGFEVPQRVLASLGVIPTGPDALETQALPTLFVVGPDGTVVWHDGCSRYRHRRTGLDELGGHIERALTTPAAAGEVSRSSLR
jgi:hypothetical protein